MKIKVVGVQQQNFTLDNGYHFDGRKVHGIDLDKKPDGLVGNVVTQFKLSNEDTKLAMLMVEVGKTYNVYFEQDGKTVAMLAEDREPVTNAK